VSLASLAQVIRRAIWGARGRLGARTPVQTRLIAHTEAGARILVSATQAQERQRMRNIDAFHLSLGWGGGFGYPFAIFPSGRVYEGRGARRPGAHTQGFNRQLAVMYPGHGDRERLNSSQINSTRGLIRGLLGSGDLSRNYQLSGHRDHIPPGQKSCPGNLVYPQLPLLRHDAVRAPEPELGDRTLTTGMSGPDVATLQRLVNAIESGARHGRDRLDDDGAFGPLTAAEVTYWLGVANVSVADPSAPRVGENTIKAFRRFRNHPPPRPELEPEEDIMASLDDLRNVVRDETQTILKSTSSDRASTRDQLNQAIRLGEAATSYAVYQIRKEAGLPDSPGDVERHVEWIRDGERPGTEGKYTLERARERIESAAVDQKMSSGGGSAGPETPAH